MEEDVTQFAEDSGYAVDIKFTRLAVTRGQILELGLPTAPPKQTDQRSFEGNQTVQREAIPPDTLAGIIQAAIDERLDREQYSAVLAQEQESQASVSRRLAPLLRDQDEDR